jgi:hypothetical protein
VVLLRREPGRLGFAKRKSTMAYQSDWKWCKLCQSICYAGSYNGTTTGACRGNPGGVHDLSESASYFVMVDEPGAPGQASWRACIKCKQLVFEGGPVQGSCAAGGAHVFQTSGASYRISGGQSGWMWCDQCMAMSYAGNAAPGPCPGPGPSQNHVHTGSGNYTILT